MTDERTIAATLAHLGAELDRAERRLQRHKATDMLTKRALPVILLGTLAVILAAGYIGQSSRASGGPSSFDLRTVVAAFRTSATTPTPDRATQRTLASLSKADDRLGAAAGSGPLPAGSQLDLSSGGVLARGLGDDRDLIAAAPSVDGSRACFALGSEASGVEGPVLLRCWQATPNSPHFIAQAPWTNLAGTPMMLVVGVAYDDIASIRVDVGGIWHAVPITNNTFFLEIPGPLQRNLITTVEATLTSGDVQTANLSVGM